MLGRMMLACFAMLAFGSIAMAGASDIEETRLDVIGLEWTYSDWEDEITGHRIAAVVVEDVRIENPSKKYPGMAFTCTQTGATVIRFFLPEWEGEAPRRAQMQIRIDRQSVITATARVQPAVAGSRDVISFDGEHAIWSAVYSAAERIVFRDEVGRTATFPMQPVTPELKRLERRCAEITSSRLNSADDQGDLPGRGQ